MARELGRRYALPSWQFTLSATTAVVEAMRVARMATGRDLVVLFDGHYHGHADELQGVPDDGHSEPEFAGILSSQVASVAFACGCREPCKHLHDLRVLVDEAAEAIWSDDRGVRVRRR